MSEDEFAEWLRANYQGFIRSVISATYASLEEVEDALQSVLVRMLRTWDKYRGRLYADENSGILMIRNEAGEQDAPFFVYLRKAMIREVLDQRQRRRPVAHDRLPEAINRPDLHLERREAEDEFGRCLEKLTESQRSYLHERFCLAIFQLPRPARDGGERPIPRAIDALRRCLHSRGFSLSYLKDLLPNLLTLLCGHSALA
jgi:hypothetical protein